jgi:iron complex transport system ATP-binding protein
MLTGTGVSVTAGDARLLDDVSVHFAPGKLSVVIGPNGAGKSTLVKVLSGQLPVLDGAVAYGERPLPAWSAAELARVRAVLSQSVELAFPLRVREVVMMGRYPHFAGTPRRADAAACEEAMQYFDVGEWAERNYLTLSGGERQRVQFARVMAQIWDLPAESPRWLLLDEPLTFLDIRYQFDFLRRIRALLEGGDLTVVCVVHDLNLAARFADHVVLLSRGRVLASGAPAAVLTPDLIADAVGIRPEEQPTPAALHLLF